MSELDNPSENDSAENVVEGTWLDDENRATLGLRSLFVLLSGALILGAEIHISSASPWRNALYFAGLNVLFPISIIWFFFGQGLRPIDWLPDQKYNAWNYGVNFEDWKSHLKWAVIIEVPVIALMALINFVIVPISGGGLEFSGITHYLNLLLVSWIIGGSLAWLIYGYLLFGMAQGFGAISTVIIFVCATLLASPSNKICITFTFIFILATSWICWKQKSFAPVLYAVLISAPFVLWMM